MKKNKMIALICFVPGALCFNLSYYLANRADAIVEGPFKKFFSIAIDHGSSFFFIMSIVYLTMSIAYFFRSDEEMDVIQNNVESLERNLNIEEDLPNKLNSRHNNKAFDDIINSIKKPKKMSLEIEKVLKDIDIVTQSIYSFDFIKNDQYYMSEIDSMIKSYMPKIMDNYFAVPETLRHSTFVNQLNITQQTTKQLKILLKQLKKIEQEGAVYQSEHVKAMDRFLKHRFPKELVSLEINT